MNHAMYRMMKYVALGAATTQRILPHVLIRNAYICCRSLSTLPTGLELKSSSSGGTVWQNKHAQVENFVHQCVLMWVQP
jgi:hypothetical protein